MKHLLTLGVLLVFTWAAANAQRRADINNCKKLLESSDAVVTKDYKKAYAYAWQALSLAKKYRNDTLTALSYTRLAASLRNFRSPGLYEYDSLALVYAMRSGKPGIIFNSLRLLAVDFLNDNQVARSADFLHRAVAIADSLQNPSYQCDIYSTKAFFFFKQFKMKESLGWYQHGLSIASASGNEYLVARAKKGVAGASIYLGKADSSYAYIFDAIDYYARSNNFFELGDAYELLATAYRAKGNLDKSNEYFLAAMAVYEKAGAVLKVQDVTLQRAQNLIAQKKYAEAKLNINNAETSFRQLHYLQGVATANVYRGQYYTAIKQHDSATLFFEASRKINRQLKIEMLELATSGYSIINRVDRQGIEKNDKLVNSTLRKIRTVVPAELADTVMEKVARQTAMPTAEKQQLKNWFNKGRPAVHLNMETALNPFTGAPSAYDSVIAFEYSNRLLELETKYKLRLKEDSIRIKSDSLRTTAQQALLAKQEVQQKNLPIAVVLLIALLIGLLAWQQYRDRKKAEFIRAAEERSRVLAEKSEAIIQKLQEDIVHRVDNMLQRVLVLVSNTKYGSNDKASFDMLENRLEPIFKLHAIFKKNKLAASVEMQAYLQQICQLVQAAFAGFNNVVISVSAAVTVDNTTAETIGLIVNEMVFNAFKYAFDKDRPGYINVQLTALPGKRYRLSVEDNGVGLPSPLQKGRGIAIIEDLAETLHGKLNIGSGTGANFEIIFM